MVYFRRYISSRPRGFLLVSFQKRNEMKSIRKVMQMNKMKAKAKYKKVKKLKEK